MPEGLPRTPDKLDEADTPAVKVPESGRFKMFLQELFSEKSDGKSPDKKESDDDDEEKSKDKKNRFSRAWQKLFPKVAQKETVDGKPNNAGGLFFERDEIVEDAKPVDAVEGSTATAVEAAESSLSAEQAPEQTVETPSVEATELLTAESEPEEAEYVEPTDETSYAEAPEPTVETENPVTAERPPSFVYDRAPEEVVTMYSSTPESGYTASAVTTTERAPERVVVGSLTTTERMRQSRMERRQKDIQREVKQTNKQLRDQEPITVMERERVVQKTVERIPQPKQPEAQRTEVKNTFERVAQANVQNNPEVKKVIEQRPAASEVVEHTVEKAPEQQPEPEQKRVAEQLLHTEIVDNGEDTKEIAYELSHEHKDMDKQSAAAWTALQASADEQAKANAAAIAAAQVATQQAANDEVNKLAEARQGIVYKQAITGGFVTAIVIIAIIIMLFLVQSR